MNISKLKKLSLKAQFSVLAVAVLAFGVFIAVQGAQQNQNNKSHAAGTGGTGNCSTVDVSSGEDLVADNCTIASGFNGSIFGNNNIIDGGLGGPVGDIFGDGNEIFGGVNGCISGNNNIIHGGVNGGVNGTGNIIQGGQGSGPCPNPSDAVTQPPTSPSPSTTPPSNYRCADGIDNDNNGFMDLNDASCHTDHNPQNPGSYDPQKDGEHGGGNTCLDSKDNNNNGLIDGGDPVCHTDGNPNNPGSFNPDLPEDGNVTPSVTVTPPASGDTTFNLNLLLHGIGKGGDSANPQSGGNANPLHPHRTVKVQIYNSQNQLIATKDGPIDFNTASGNFTGTVDMGTGIADGAYLIKVKTEQFLNTQVPGIQNIAKGANNIPQTILVNGDINGDNTINIQDYNILMGCYSDFLPAVSCTADNKILSDLDDDGSVNQYDYNLFLRELTNRQGQ